MYAQQKETTFFGISLGYQLFGLCQNSSQIGALFADNVAYFGFQLIKFMSIALRYRTGNDQGGSGIIYKNGIYLIHNGVIMWSLHQVAGGMGHIIPKIIKAELIVGAIGNISVIGCPTSVGIGLVPVYTIYRKSVEFKYWCHPCTIPFGQI